jgi:hypothetical protein
MRNRTLLLLPLLLLACAGAQSQGPTDSPDLSAPPNRNTDKTALAPLKTDFLKSVVPLSDPDPRCKSGTVDKDDHDKVKKNPKKDDGCWHRKPSDKNNLSKPAL